MEFDAKSLQISYNGEPIEGLTGYMTAEIEITPIGISTLDTDPYTQLVFLSPSPDTTTETVDNDTESTNDDDEVDFQEQPGEPEIVGEVQEEEGSEALDES